MYYCYRYRIGYTAMSNPTRMSAMFKVRYYCSST
jgi:hypothetical protein